MGDAPVILAGITRAVGAVHGAVSGFLHLEMWRPVFLEIIGGTSRGEMLFIKGAEMQERQVRRIDITLKRLQPVALAQSRPDPALALRQQVGFEFWQVRRRISVAHVDPDNVTPFADSVRRCTDLVLDTTIRTFCRCFQAFARDVKLPAMVDATKTVLFVAAVIQRCAAVGTMVLKDSDLAGCRPKGDEILPQNSQPDRRRIGLQFFRMQRGNPVLTHQVTHGCSRPGLCQQIIVLFSHKSAGSPWTMFPPTSVSNERTCLISSSLTATSSK